jgi:choline dehydrogenase-like flavoprotein
VEEFDYVVVGGGSAGCVVASRLSEDSKVRVCLLEAGGGGNNWVVKAPIGIAIQVPSKTNNWAFETEPQPGLNGRKGYQPRGKALGGSSAINAMVYIRGHRSDYDGWAALGTPGGPTMMCCPTSRSRKATRSSKTTFTAPAVR